MGEELFPNQKELEKKFPEISIEECAKRIDIMMEELGKLGFKIVLNKNRANQIYFRKPSKNGCTHLSFGVWQLKHEPDEDFHATLNRVIEQHTK